MFGRFKLNYRLRIEATGARVIVGRPTPAFVRAVREIAQLHKIERGEIDCRGTGANARLRFSRDFPDRGRQAIRNVWQEPTAPAPTPGRRANG
ncbi:DUF3634 family protein [Salinisphaera sp. USBA-960]|nr:DUF3634 family protein [Salifodinibacter halophilus]NNC27124.1 DUF3634 family protein [Salifodinibacter halophilus]